MFSFIATVISIVSGWKTYSVVALMITQAIAAGFGMDGAGATDWSAFDLANVDWRFFTEGAGLGALRAGVDKAARPY